MYAFASYITTRSSVFCFFLGGGAVKDSGSASQLRNFDLLHDGATSCLDPKHLQLCSSAALQLALAFLHSPSTLSFRASIKVPFRGSWSFVLAKLA